MNTKLVALVLVGLLGFIPDSAIGQEPDPAELEKNSPEDDADEILKNLDSGTALLDTGGEFESGRDPFEDVFARPDKGPRPEGLAGMDINRITLRGVLHGAFGDLALIQGVDKQLYYAKVGQRFWDGLLVEIQKDSVVFEKEVFDQLGRPKPPIIKPIFLRKPKKKKNLKIVEGP